MINLPVEQISHVVKEPIGWQAKAAQPMGSFLTAY